MNLHSENDIAKVLNGLRDTQPSTGLEQRILHGIQHRAPARTPLFMRWQMLAAVPSTALAIFLTAHILTTNSSLTVAPPPTAASGAPTTAPGAPSFAHFAKGGVSSNARPLSPTLSSRPERSAVERPAVPPAEAQLSAADRQALEDANAPSRPAPPLPLTHDERILAAAARRAGSVEVAQFDPLTEDPLHAARESDAVKLAVQRLLHQLAAAEALNPTAPAPEPTASNIPAPEPESAPDSQ